MIYARHLGGPCPSKSVTDMPFCVSPGWQAATLHARTYTPSITTLSTSTPCIHIHHTSRFTPPVSMAQCRGYHTTRRWGTVTRTLKGGREFFINTIRTSSHISYPQIPRVVKQVEIAHVIDTSSWYGGVRNLVYTLTNGYVHSVETDPSLIHLARRPSMVPTPSFPLRVVSFNGLNQHNDI